MTKAAINHNPSPTRLAAGIWVTSRPTPNSPSAIPATARTIRQRPITAPRSASSHLVLSTPGRFGAISRRG